MNESLFAKYVAKFFPKLQRLIEKVNGKRNKNLTYLHKGENAMLRQEYSPDNKWESTSVNTTYVAADFVAVDSELPVKSRDSIASANGKLPKIGMSKILKESDINNINVMEAQGGNAQKIVKKLSDDAVACSVGIDERNEYNFLFALSNGYVAIKDEDTPNALLRLNFNYLAANTFGATTKNLPSLEDIKRVISKADADGNSIIQICIAKSTYDKLRQTKEAKELVANYNGQSFTNDTILPTPTATKFNEAFADDNNGSITWKDDGGWTVRFLFGPAHTSFQKSTLVPYLGGTPIAEGLSTTNMHEYDVLPVALCPSGRRDGVGVKPDHDATGMNNSYAFNTYLVSTAKQSGKENSHPSLSQSILHIICRSANV